MATAQLRVLIVDDNVDLARMTQILLKHEGYEAKMAFDGPGAIEAARAFKPDAVLLDLGLPGMSGSQVATELKGIPELRGCVLIAVSGYDAETVECSSPFERHLQKPVDPEALIKLLRGLRPSQAPARLPDTPGALIEQ
jgi:CheY-like chemotaxis protein